MDLISLIVAIAVLGLVVYLVTLLVPMPEQFKKAIVAVALVAVLLYVLRALAPALHLAL